MRLLVSGSITSKAYGKFWEKLKVMALGDSYKGRNMNGTRVSY